MLDREMIAYSLSLLGVKSGDALLVHSALTALGEVDGGADTVIDGMLDTLGKDGTLIMSTLTGWAKPFDPDHTPSAVGALSECFRKREGVVRSRHPVHSVAAYGRLAKWITDGHDQCRTGCGEGTPYEKLASVGGKVLLLGVDMDRNTIMHMTEERADLAYLLSLDIPAPVYDPNKVFTLVKFPPGHRDFLSTTPLLRRAGCLTEGRIGHASAMLIDIRSAAEVIGEELRKNPALFLCSNPNCHFCDWARKLLNREAIDYSRYQEHCCPDPVCECCAVNESFRPNN